MSKNGIGPQGLGHKSHNGFWIGSPVKQKKQTYKDATDKFEEFNQATDTVTMRRGPHITAAMEGASDETYLRFKGKQPINTKYTQSGDGSVTAYSLRKKITSPTKLKDACYRKVKASYDVFPSAYASGAIARCRKNK